MDILKKILDTKVFLGIQAVITGIFLYFLFNLAILPDKYLYTIVVVVVLACLFNYVLQIKTTQKSVRSIFSRIFAILISALLVFLSVEINRGKDFIEGISGMEYETDALSVIVLKDSNYMELSDLESKTIGINNQIDLKNVDHSRKELKTKLKEVNFKEYESWDLLSDALYNKDVDAILVNEAYRGMLEDKYPELSVQTRVIYQVKIKTKVENLANDGAIDDGVFNILISGIDVDGPVSTKSRSDVNMVVTVNMNTNKILLTSIPRDYFVELGTIGEMDKLTHAGVHGPNESVETISKLLDVEIDYYVRLNFTSLITLVDAVGGVDVYSDLTFKPWNGPRMVYKGMNHFDGVMALGFARERYAYGYEGDRHRIKNQQAVLTAIIERFKQPEVLGNYKEILKEVEGMFETNMSSKDLSYLIKTQLDKLSGYEIINQYLDGSNYSAECYSMPGKGPQYVMKPYPETIEKAKKQIEEIMFGK